MSRKKSELVGMDEVKDAVLAMLVERFDGGMLTWQVATEGLAWRRSRSSKRRCGLGMVSRRKGTSKRERRHASLTA